MLATVPGALVLVVGGLFASWLFDLGDQGVALVGHVPRGLPAPELPSLSIVQDHYSAVVIASAALGVDEVDAFQVVNEGVGQGAVLRQPAHTILERLRCREEQAAVEPKNDDARNDLVCAILQDIAKDLRAGSSRRSGRSWKPTDSSSESARTTSTATCIVRSKHSSARAPRWILRSCYHSAPAHPVRRFFACNTSQMQYL